MFSSNQIFDVSCEPDKLENILKTIIGLYGEDIFTRDDSPVKIAFSEPATGIYAIGSGSMSGNTDVHTEKGWTDYPFEYDPKITAMIIGKWFKKQTPRIPIPNTDGSYELGIRARSLHSVYTGADRQLVQELDAATTNNKWTPSQCIAVFTPTWLVYDK